MRDSKEESMAALLHEYTQSSLHPTSKISNLPQRDRLQAWTIDLFPEIHCSVHTRLLGCSYLDQYLKCKPDTNPEAHRLLAVSCFALALKFEESFLITPEQIFELFNKKFSVESVKVMERYILLALDWSLARPTAAYIIRLLLEATCECDYSRIAEKADAFAIVGTVNSAVACKGEFLVAVTGIVLSLRTLGFTGFLEEWWIEITKNFEVSKSDVEGIARFIIEEITN